MPLYEYHCSACGHRFERIVKFSDAPLTTCPKCGKEALDQLISAPAVQFKGSGWYVTDYARKSAPASSSTKPETASAGKDSGATTTSGATSTSGSADQSASPSTSTSNAAGGSSTGGAQNSGAKDSASKGSK